MKRHEKTAVAIGTFDGVHLGHQYLIKELLSVAKAEKLRTAVVALSRPVKQVNGVLSTVEEKLHLLTEYPIDEIVVLPVGPEMTNQEPEEFYRDFLINKLNVRCLVVGDNFAFGHKRRGTINWLKPVAESTGVLLKVVSPKMYHRKPISSSRIRQLLSAGRMTYANRLLGRHYRIEGIPVPGKQIGRTLGFPTVNLSVPDEKLLPQGVFAALVENAGSVYTAVANIGFNPTIETKTGSRLLVEAHLLNFTGTWPRTPTTFYLVKHLRNERKFASRELLSKQIAHDVASAKKLLSDF